MNSHQKSLVSSNTALFLNSQNYGAREYAVEVMRSSVKRKGDGASVLLQGHTGMGDYDSRGGDWGMEMR